MRHLSLLSVPSLLLIFASQVGAQARPAVRQLGAVEARSKEPLASANSIRTLPGGRVLVNDAGKRRVLLFDSTLTAFTVVADSTSATANAYSGRIGGLVAYRGDSSLFVDPTSMSMLVIDGLGKIARVMSVPRAEDAGALAAAFGGTGFDSKGRLIYRGAPRLRMAGPPPSGNAPFVMPEPPDSAPIMRVDLQSREVDTVGFIKTPKIRMDVSRDANGGIRMMSQLNPLPVVDDWTILSDGSVAIVRGRDYHVDFTSSDGTRLSAPKIPFEWQRLTDEDKVAFIDSVKAARERMGANAPMVAGGAAAGGASVDGGRQVMIFEGTGGLPGGAGGDGPLRAQAGAPRAIQVNFVAPSELPDYKPAFFAGSVRADAQSNLWIRTIPTAAIAGGPIYDVINRQGQLVDRVQIPAGRTIAGFGANGAVYLSGRENNQAFVERARVR